MMWILLALFLAVIADPQSCPNSVTFGSATVSGSSRYFIRTSGSGTITASGSTLTIPLGPRFYIANGCYSSMANNVFMAYKCVGGTISYTTNVSGSGCGTNAAFYLVGMPGAGASGTGDYYCDANCVGGQCCPEMDLMEANRHALQVTPHSCSSSNGGCDGGGCGKKVDSTNGYGYGSSFKINTANSFNVKHTFSGSGTSITGITTVISQGSNSLTITHGSECGSNLSGMGKWMAAGMVPVFSYWSSSGMSWLDGAACSSSQDANPEAKGNWVISNLSFSGCSTSNAEVSDMSATTDASSNQPLIIGISVALAVAILVIGVLIVVLVMKKKVAHAVENA